jgi:dGTPase
LWVVLGTIGGKKIIEKYPHLKEVHGYHMNDFGAIVAAASLAHDIGNPPLDIPGEKAIESIFFHWKRTKIQRPLTQKNGKI